MKILIVCSGKSKEELKEFDFRIDQPFTYEQIESLKDFHVSYTSFFIKGKGLSGYLKNYFALRKKIKLYSPDIVHAHYGLSGLLASLQRITPTIITFHGSDINEKKIRLYSYIASKLSNDNIFVHNALPPKIYYKRQANIIPCGVDLKTFLPISKIEARKMLGLDNRNKYILFSSRFNNQVKNYQLAKTAISLLGEKVELLELTGYSRKEVNLLLNAVDLLLFTSISEGSPQAIKEAMACNCPIVSVDVGDVKNIINDIEGCYITSYDPNDIAQNINSVLSHNKRTNGNEYIKPYAIENVALKIYNLYCKILNK